MSVVELAPLVSLLGVMVRHCAPPPHMGVASQQKIFDTVRRLAANDLLKLLANRLVVDSPVAVRRGDNQPFARLINALASECHWKVGKVPPLFSDENEKKKLTDWIKSVDFDRERVRDMTAALLRRLGAVGGDAQRNFDDVERVASEEERHRSADAMARMRGLEVFENLAEEDVVATADATPEVIEDEAPVTTPPPEAAEEGSEAAMVEAAVALENEIATAEAALVAEEEAAMAAPAAVEGEGAVASRVALAVGREAATDAPAAAAAALQGVPSPNEKAAVEVGRPAVTMAVVPAADNILQPGKRWKFLGRQWRKISTGLEVCESIFDKLHSQKWEPGCTVKVQHPTSKQAHHALVLAVGRASKKPYVILFSEQGFEQSPISGDVTFEAEATAEDLNRVEELWTKYQETCIQREEMVEEVQLPVRKRSAVRRRGPQRAAKQAATRRMRRSEEEKKKEEVEHDDEDFEDEEDEVAKPKKPARKRRVTRKPIVKEEKVKGEEKRREPRSRSSSLSCSPHRSRSHSPQRLHRHRSHSRSPVRGCCSCHRDAHQWHEDSHCHTAARTTSAPIVTDAADSEAEADAEAEAAATVTATTSAIRWICSKRWLPPSPCCE